ncbi:MULTISPECIES: hypothetical protein [unclassified Rhizobium]|uniref:hypothetical protein n=1 Tax=unclassified Rhizobium TaxID=2613769 RepID=UPI00115E6F5B|nr:MULTISPECIES: hypothetical protein [unclassified Rhizobium]TQX90250.1 hypothetical protein EQW76_11140 [Rhizobium sp. rho-13.1]TQY16200.1 hypothetical protein EQW74_10730 [Rhizobium sp. rho-1.1]
MATTTTQATSVNGTAWTLIADGSTILSAQIQIDPVSPSVNIAVAQALPAVASNDFIVLQRERDTSIVLTLNATDKVYAKSPSANSVTVRASLGSR